MTTHYRQLTQGQRYQIEAGMSAAESQASIAKRVGVHPSTISREVRRNSTQNIYKAVSAAHESDARRAGARITADAGQLPDRGAPRTPHCADPAGRHGHRAARGDGRSVEGAGRNAGPEGDTTAPLARLVSPGGRNRPA